ncbi:MAG: hypothetical protein R3C03_11210 [Pirellulaceae bacterium]
MTEAIYPPEETMFTPNDVNLGDWTPGDPPLSMPNYSSPISLDSSVVYSNDASILFSPQNDLMDSRNFSLFQYRRMFMAGRTPRPEEMIGAWRGVNKGIVNLAGYNQFIKEITPVGNCLFGDNIQVHQVSNNLLRCFGWQPKQNVDGTMQREGKFAVQSPSTRTGIGSRRFRHGAVFSYRDGGNSKHDPVRVIVDRVVMIDDNHMLGRASARLGPFQIPLAYFVLERISY